MFCSQNARANSDAHTHTHKKQRTEKHLTEKVNKWLGVERRIRTTDSDKQPKKKTMEPIHRHTTIGTYLLLFAIVLSISSIQPVHCGCRMQDRNPCETVCQWNATLKSYNCTLRVIVILPKMETVEASLPRVINDIFRYAQFRSQPALFTPVHTAYFRFYFIWMYQW